MFFIVHLYRTNSSNYGDASFDISHVFIAQNMYCVMLFRQIYRINEIFLYVKIDKPKRELFLRNCVKRQYSLSRSSRLHHYLFFLSLPHLCRFRYLFTFFHCLISHAFFYRPLSTNPSFFALVSFCCCIMWPYQDNRLTFKLLPTFTHPLTYWFVTLSIRVTPHTHLNIRISATSNFLSADPFVIQHSELIHNDRSDDSFAKFPLRQKVYGSYAVALTVAISFIYAIVNIVGVEHIWHSWSYCVLA